MFKRIAVYKLLGVYCVTSYNISGMALAKCTKSYKLLTLVRVAEQWYKVAENSHLTMHNSIEYKPVLGFNHITEEHSRFSLTEHKTHYETRGL